MSYETDLHAKDGAWRADAKIAAGVDDANNTHPLNCTTDGTLEVDITSTSSGPIDVIVDNIVPVSQSGTWTVNLATEPTIDIGEVSLIPASTAFNVFANNDVVPSGIETTILTYTATTVKTYINQVIGWGTYVGEFLVRKNGTIVGGGRTSTAEQTLIITYSSPISATTGDVITVTILEYGSGLHQFRCNLLGQ